MPALVVFGRRSRIGSDDLYCPAFLLILYQIPFVVLAVSYIAFGRRCSSLSFTTDGIPFWFMLAAIPIYGFMACVYLMIVHVSARGTIVEYERRMLMPRLLQVHVLWSMLMLAYGIAGVAFWYNVELCFPDAHFVLAISGAMVAEVSFTLTFGFCILGGAPLHLHNPDDYQTAGNDQGTASQYELDRSMPNSDVYVPQEERWQKRCQSLCACVRVATCNLFGGAGTQHDSMSVVANVFARLFYGSPDLVISDIVAGFILLAAVQAHEEEQDLVARCDENTVVTSGEGVATIHELRQRLQTDAGYGGTHPTSSSSKPPPAHSADADHEPNSYVAISMPSSTASHGTQDTTSPPVTETLLPVFDPDLAARVDELAHFSKYAVGIYGWMLYVWSHPWTATFRLAFSCVKTSRPYIHGDNLFHLGQAALQLETHVRSHDIVYASFKNTVYRPAFCVVLDHDRKEVVVAIRGTLSLEDCLTDAIAYGKPMDDLADRFGCDGRGEFAHQGFLHCAEGVYHELNRLGLLQMLFDPQCTASIALDEVNVCTPGEYREYGLVITGHSLGASTAVLLSIMLRPQYPNLRCFAFSPPGCTLSPNLARRCDSFVTSVVVGHDIIARASLTSAEDLRDQVIDLIGRSKVSKSAILRQVVAWRKPHELLHDEIDSRDTGIGNRPGYSMHLAHYRTMLQRIQASEPINPLTIPGRIIHLKRNETYRHVGCWVCCRPGSGGICCTERTNYDFAWSSVAHFQRIRIARTMLDDHFPDKVHHVLQDCARRHRPTDNACLYST